jgi:hypothetical protein
MLYNGFAGPGKPGSLIIRQSMIAKGRNFENAAIKSIEARKRVDTPFEIIRIPDRNNFMQRQ